MANPSKAYAQLLALKQLELARAEREVSSTRETWQKESETLQTLLSYQQDYHALNQAEWKGKAKDPLSPLHRLKNGSRFSANLSLAINQQKKKKQQFEQIHRHALDTWKNKKQLKQRLEDIIEEKRLSMRVDQERRQEQLDSESRLDIGSFGLD